jgi:hypothetical protein
LDCNDKWKNIDFFPYVMLRKRWMTTLLFNLSKSLDPKIFDIASYKRLVSKLYDDKSNGFYVHAPGSDLDSTDAVVKYVTRYIGRPVMAQSRITAYDGINVSYWYQRHEDDEVVNVTEHAFEFIKKLIIHIPEKHFKMLRYYGIYAKHHSQEKKLRRCISGEKKRFYKRHLDWRSSILMSFGYDPLCCPTCGSSMLVLEVYHKKTALFERFRKVMKGG